MDPQGRAQNPITALISQARGESSGLAMEIAMLILTRRIGESLIIDTFTKVTVSAIKGASVTFFLDSVDADGIRIEDQATKASIVSIGDQAVIMPGVELRVVGVTGHQVKVGITAPRSTTIHREEIQARVRAGERSYRQKLGAA